MADLEMFSAEHFEPKKWINQACLARPSQEALERQAEELSVDICLSEFGDKMMLMCRYLAEVEMRLHLAAEDVEISQQEQSRDALYRIPAAVQEISHVKASFTMHC